MEEEAPMADRSGRILAIDSWCNPFTELGIRSIFTENPEVAFMMGDQCCLLYTSFPMLPRLV